MLAVEKFYHSPVGMTVGITPSTLDKIVGSRMINGQVGTKIIFTPMMRYQYVAGVQSTATELRTRIAPDLAVPSQQEALPAEGQIEDVGPGIGTRACQPAVIQHFHCTACEGPSATCRQEAGGNSGFSSLAVEFTGHRLLAGLSPVLRIG